MARKKKEPRPIYGHVETAQDITEINRKIRNQLRRARTPERITELVRRSLYLITLTHSPFWKKKFGSKLETLRKRAIEEYRKTAKLGNRMLIKLGLSPRFDVVWGDGRKIEW